MKHRFVGRTAEPAGAAVDFDRPIDACDHVHHDPWSIGGGGPMIGRDKFHRVHIGQECGKELIHTDTLGANGRDRLLHLWTTVDNLWVVHRSSTDYPPQIHRVIPLPTHRHESYGSPGCSAAARATDGGATFCAFSVGRAAPRAWVCVTRSTWRSRCSAPNHSKIPRHKRFLEIVDTGGITLL